MSSTINRSSQGDIVKSSVPSYADLCWHYPGNDKFFDTSILSMYIVFHKMADA